MFIALLRIASSHSARTAMELFITGAGCATLR
jgi:hypothetical protein